MPRRAAASRAAPPPKKAAASSRAVYPRAQVSATYKNADVGRQALQAFDATMSSADGEGLRDRNTLVAFSAALVRDEPLASGVVDTHLSHVVATGLRVHPRINAHFLGLDEEAANEFQEQARFIFEAHADHLDIERRRSFVELQELALSTPMVRGDALGIRRGRMDTGDILATKVQLVEGDRLSNPNQVFGGFNNLTWSGPLPAGVARRTAGIDFDRDGVPVQYHVASRHPFDFALGAELSWTAVRAFDDFGTQQVLHLWFVKRIGETRGLPVFAPVIELFKQLGRYTDSEVMAAVVNAMFAVIVKRKRDDGALSFDDESDQIESGEVDEGEYRLQSGTMVGVPAGDELEFADPKRPNTSFGPFIEAVLEHAGMALGTPYELLVGHYTSNYSAARAALLQAWKTFWRRREWLVKGFCQPVYEWVISEAVARGLLAAPGFFEHPLVRAAWLGTEWIGDPPGQIDQLKEVQASRELVEGGFSTEQAETAALTGGDWGRNIEQRKREIRLRTEAGLEPVPKRLGQSAPPAPAPDPDALDSDLETPPARRAA